ncbi:hypothetical protein S23_09850 [Bradyrhizobium cosmicum]|uniref:Uncharacterized protein n=1 Tax=Bradyrhizobium cosmicum TaxID=1404864 RepID=A0AAI8M950_9BRAD|nr:hypothetical protein S23_09850 [Bradyrhizobium cosmicum]
MSGADDGDAREGTKSGECYGSSAGEQEIASGNGQINIPGLEGGYPFKGSI